MFAAQICVPQLLLEILHSVMDDFPQTACAVGVLAAFQGTGTLCIGWVLGSMLTMSHRVHRNGVIAYTAMVTLTLVSCVPQNQIISYETGALSFQMPARILLPSRDALGQYGLRLMWAQGQL